MRVVIWCGEGANQMALCKKVNEQFELVGIVLERKSAKRKFELTTLLKKIIDRIRFAAISNAWYGMLAYYKERYGSYPDVPVKIVQNINNEETIAFTKNVAPDVIMVSGTSLVREPLLSISVPKGILNLHTGLSPYVKGGPNCTNWCIANNEFHLIGNTIMWIDKGIDSGNIVATDSVEFSGQETLLEVHIKVMEAAHALYLRAVDCLEKMPEACPNVVQKTIGEGKLFKNNMWNSTAKKRLIDNFKKFPKSIQSENYKKKKEKIKLVKLN